jgi:GNAT superfamily N-acetyltransferase
MITIKSFEIAHLDDLYRISLETGHAGRDASALYGDPKLMGHIYSAPYAHLEPDLVLLAADHLGIAGFALGVMDTQAWEDRLEREWWPKLRTQYQQPSQIPVSDWTADQRRVHMIHHPARAPSEISAAYPAHLHLNLLPRLQGAGVGRFLLQAWLDLVASREPRAVHVGINRQNQRAVRFWRRTGFREIVSSTSERGRTIWMGRKLSMADGVPVQIDRSS